MIRTHATSHVGLRRSDNSVVGLFHTSGQLQFAASIVGWHHQPRMHTGSNILNPAGEGTATGTGRLLVDGCDNLVQEPGSHFLDLVGSALSSITPRLRPGINTPSPTLP
jgi:hypothetical protein